LTKLHGLKRVSLEQTVSKFVDEEAHHTTHTSSTCDLSITQEAVELVLVTISTLVVRLDESRNPFGKVAVCCCLSFLAAEVGEIGVAVEIAKPGVRWDICR